MLAVGLHAIEFRRRPGKIGEELHGIFTDLDANPRHLTVDDVPRPRGASPFERGDSVE